MRKGRFFKYLLAMVMAVSTAGSAVAQEERTIRYGLGTEGNALIFKVLDGSSPSGVTLTSSNFNKGEFYESLTEKAPGWYVNVGETGTINFQNFYYEVSSIGVRRNISGTVPERAVDTELNISMYPIMGAVPSVVFDNKVDWSEPACTDVPIKINGSKSTMSGISQLDVSVPASHWEGIVYVTNRNTYVREVEIKYYLPEIRVGFTNGNKGYDISVGDNNAQIKGFISAHPGAFVGSDGNLAQGVSFEYESSDPSVVSVTTSGNVGTLVAHKEGDVTITAKLMNAGQVVNTYSYPLHSFAAGEGLTWNRYGTLYKSSSSNNNSYTFGGANPIQGIDWSSSNILKTQTTIWENESNTQTQGQYKQIVCLEAPAPTSKNWRAAVQKLSCEILVPKYTAVESTLKFGANTTLGNESKSNVTYGYEFVDLGIKTDANTSFATASANADARIAQISWNTNSTSEQATSVGSYRTNGTNGITYLRNGANEYRKYNIITAWNNGEGYVGDHYTAGSYWKYDNSKNANSYTETRFFAAMAFLQNQVNYSATASFGYQDIPTYRYYAFVDFYANYETENNYLGQEILFVDGKNKTKNLNAGNVSFVPNRTGYKLLGWSTDKDAKTAEYPVNGEFSPYDKENGGGVGPVKLYAVWQANTYTVTLNRQGGDSGSTSVTVTYDAPMPTDGVIAPKRYGYTFGGYFTGENGTGEQYYDAVVGSDGKVTTAMTSHQNWNIAANTTLYAKWTANVCKVKLLPNGTGAVAGTPYVMVTHGQKFPEQVDGHAVVPPTRKGYIFNGFYLGDNNDRKYYYDKNMQTESCATWPYQADYYVLADWTPKTTKITFDFQGGQWGTNSTTATFNADMPQINAPQRLGYNFAGYYDQPNGKGTRYYSSNYGNAVSARTWNKDVEEETLYAFWEAKPMKVEFHYNNKTPEEVVTVEGYKMDSPNNSSLRSTNPVVPTPTMNGYTFGGWVDAVTGGYMVYDSDGEAAEGMYWQNNNGELVWKGRDGNETTRVYPFWVKEALTLNVKVLRDNNDEGTDGVHRYVGITVGGIKNIKSFVRDGYITVDGVHFLSYEENDGADQVKSVLIDEAPVWHFETMTINGKTVYEISTVKNGKTVYLGNKLAQIDNTTGEIQYRPDGLGIQEYEAPKGRYFSIYGAGFLCLDDINDEAYGRVLHWMEGEGDQPWQFEEKGFSAQLKPIMIIPAGGVVSGELNTENIFSMIEDELLPSDSNKDFPYSYNIGKDEDKDVFKGVLYVDMSSLSKIVENDNSLSNFKKKASDNCLFFMPENYTNTNLGNNVVCKYGTKYESLTNLVVTDKVPFFTPYEFHVGNGVRASYKRENKNKWNSLCLPFPIKKIGDMQYYKLYGSDNLRLAFISIDDSTIPANTPVACYGNGTFTLENSDVTVPADVSGEQVYSKTVDAISCDNIQDYVDGKDSKGSDKTWNFKGVRFATYVYGENNDAELPKYAERSLVYYFANDEFRYVNPEGRVKFAPFRAYLQAPEGSSAKTFSLLVFDEDGATDITEIIDGNAGVANGKIYDLFGRRVKTPLKGHIYIVDGKKKQY